MAAVRILLETPAVTEGTTFNANSEGDSFNAKPIRQLAEKEGVIFPFAKGRATYDLRPHLKNKLNSFKVDIGGTKGRIRKYR